MSNVTQTLKKKPLSNTLFFFRTTIFSV